MSESKVVDNSRRLRYYAVTNSDLALIFRGSVRIVQGQLPNDTEVRDTFHDYLRRSIIMYVSSSEFDEVKDGDLIPCGGVLKIESTEPSQPETGSYMDRPPLFY